ncbi:MAG: hypothetical protein HeimAB125_16190 [Candidatus Heimdallarchaeota archaeon AB_125]|nr:MAG: hypothetical protein HeimAB125_16190 [Candidatus Heimdallarchaeota archaeon AB_125]
MSKFQIHHTEDFITLESEKQAISVVGFSLTKMEEGVLTQLSRRMANYFDSFGYSYVIQLAETSMKLYLIISAQNVGEVIGKVSNFLEKMQKIAPISPFLVVSRIDHHNVAEDLQINYLSPLRKTSESRIIKIGERFMVFSSIIFSDEEPNYISQYFRDLLSFKQCTLNLSSRILKSGKNKTHKHKKGILLTYTSSFFDDCIEYLQQLKTISFQYKEKMNFSIRFHSLNEIKRSKILFLLGLTNKSDIQLSWDTYFKIEKFIPSIRSSSKKRVKPLKSVRKREITRDSRNRFRLFPLLKSVKLPVFLRRKTNLDQENKEKPIILVTSNQQEIKSKKVPELDSEEEENNQNLVFPYGQIVSEKDMKKLIKNIPSPP